MQECQRPRAITEPTGIKCDSFRNERPCFVEYLESFTTPLSGTESGPGMMAQPALMCSNNRHKAGI